MCRSQGQHQTLNLLCLPLRQQQSLQRPACLCRNPHIKAPHHHHLSGHSQAHLSQLPNPWSGTMPRQACVRLIPHQTRCPSHSSPCMCNMRLRLAFCPPRLPCLETSLHQTQLADSSLLHPLQSLSSSRLQLSQGCLHSVQQQSLCELQPMALKTRPGCNRLQMMRNCVQLPRMQPLLVRQTAQQPGVHNVSRRGGSVLDMVQLTRQMHSHLQRQCKVLQTP